MDASPARSSSTSTFDAQPLALGPDVRLTCAQLEAVAHEATPAVRLTDAARTAMDASCDALDRLRADGAPVYGLTTGFGPLVAHPSADAALDLADAPDAAAPDAAPPAPAAHGRGLLAHLATGAGPLTPPPVVRATMVARGQALAQGYSALPPATLAAYLGLLADGLVPAVPTVGSLGASGDLTPLAHVARVLTGAGRVLRTGDAAGPGDATRPAADALADAGRDPVTLTGRHALALVNGTSYMTAYAALAVARAERLLALAEALTGWAYRLLGCSLQPLLPRLHAVRGHAGQATSAMAIHEEATRDGNRERPERPLQEVYSLRCAPQVLGACRDQLAYAKRVVATELNGVTDNPVIVPDDPPLALHGGNFQGQQVAFAADALSAAVTQIGVLAERQLALLLTPARNGGAPLLLAWQPGATSGLAGAQLTATALVAELRHHAQPSATASIPTNGGNQDVVSMGALAARTAYEQTPRLASILAVTGLALAQLTHLRAAGRADGPAPAPPPWMPPVEPVRADRALHDEIATLADAWLTP
jgi:histidine ammonia-lyase/tyrosine ammonia-lyase